MARSVVLLAFLLPAGLAVGGESMLDDDPGPYVQTGSVWSLPFLATEAPASQVLNSWREKYKALPADRKARYCVREMLTEHAHFNFDMYPGVRYATTKPYTDDPEACPTDELVRLGRVAVPYLIAAIDSTEKTQMRLNRWMGDPCLLQDAALHVLEKMAFRQFSTGMYLDLEPAHTRAAVIAEVREWWRTSADSDEASWASAALSAGSGNDKLDRAAAAVALYHRKGRASFPALASVFGKIPPEQEGNDERSSDWWGKLRILEVMGAEPCAEAKPVFARALDDGAVDLQVRGARGLWALGDKSGLDRIIKDVERGYPAGFGNSFWNNAGDIVGFLASCSTDESRRAVLKCLGSPNPRIRNAAINEAPKLRMEQTAAALVLLFDDPYVMAGSHQSTCGNVTTQVPPRQICDEAATAFCNIVPDAPRFGGDTDEEQMESIRAVRAWWEKNRAGLVWDGERGVFRMKGAN